MFPFLESLVEERIQKAMQEGQFKNLPGEGKPIPLSDYDFLNPDVWLGNKILKNAGYLPPWIELAWDIDHDQRRLEKVQAGYHAWLATTRAVFLGRPRAQEEERRAAHATFQRHLERYVHLAEPLRDKIENFNVMVPIRALEKVNLWVDYRVEQMEQRYAALCRELGCEPPAAQLVTRARRAAKRPRRDLDRAHDILGLVRAAAELRRDGESEVPEKPAPGWAARFLQRKK